MADPLTIYAIASTALSAVSSIYKGKQQQAANESQARLYDLSADETLRRAKINETLLRRESDEFIGNQIVSVSGAGRGMEGSALSLLYDTAYKTSQEVIRNNELAEFESNQLRYKARLSRFYGEQAADSANLELATNLLGSGYQFYATQSQDKGSVEGLKYQPKKKGPSLTSGKK